MSQEATLIHPQTRDTKVVEANSSESRKWEAQGYVLMTRAGEPTAPTAALPAQDQGAPMGDLGNMRLALRSALNEGARRRTESRYKQIAPIAGGVPGTIGSVVEMIRGSIRPSVEKVFGDVMTGVSEEQERKRLEKVRLDEKQQKEMDRINNLRLEFGSAIPANVTDLETAISLVTPLIDAERNLTRQKSLRSLVGKMGNAQAEDNDVESLARRYARGEISFSNVPSDIRAQVSARADAIMVELEAEVSQEYKNAITLRIERKITDYATEIVMLLQDDDLTVAEQRELIDYIDELEAQAKAATKKEGERSWGGPGKGTEGGPPLTSMPGGGFAQGWINQFKK